MNNNETLAADVFAEVFEVREKFFRFYVLRAEAELSGDPIQVNDAESALREFEAALDRAYMKATEAIQ